MIQPPTPRGLGKAPWIGLGFAVTLMLLFATIQIDSWWWKVECSPTRTTYKASSRGHSCIHSVTATRKKKWDWLPGRESFDEKTLWLRTRFNNAGAITHQVLRDDTTEQTRNAPPWWSDTSLQESHGFSPLSAIGNTPCGHTR